MSRASFSVAGSYEMIKIYGKLTSQVSKIVKAKSKDSVKEALSDNEKMKAFAAEIYAKLTLDIKSKITFESFIAMVIEKKEAIMKVGRNMKKLDGKK